MTHAEKLLAIVEREERRKASEDERRRQLGRLREPMRANLLAADVTVEHTRLLQLRLRRRWNPYFGLPEGGAPIHFH